MTALVTSTLGRAVDTAAASYRAVDEMLSSEEIMLAMHAKLDMLLAAAREQPARVVEQLGDAGIARARGQLETSRQVSRRRRLTTRGASNDASSVAGVIADPI